MIDMKLIYLKDEKSIRRYGSGQYICYREAPGDVVYLKKFLELKIKTEVYNRVHEKDRKQRAPKPSNASQ